MRAWHAGIAAEFDPVSPRAASQMGITTGETDRAFVDPAGSTSTPPAASDLTTMIPTGDGPSRHSTRNYSFLGRSPANIHDGVKSRFTPGFSIKTRTISIGIGPARRMRSW